MGKAVTHDAEIPRVVVTLAFRALLEAAHART